MAGSSDKSGDKGPEAPVDPARPSEGLDTLMNNPAAAMAAATAFGLSMATQMSKLWLGSLQGAMEVTGQLARQLEDERKTADASRVRQPDVAEQTQAPSIDTAQEAKAKKPVSTRAKAPAAKPEPTTKAAPAKAVGPMKTKSDGAAPVKAVASKAKKVSGKGDDLKKIDGIGPKLEQILKGRGIARFQDLVEMDDTALAALDADLGLGGRALRDDWTGQARRLVSGRTKSRKVQSGS